MTPEEKIAILETQIESLTDLVESLVARDICPPGIPGPRGLDGLDGKNGNSGRDGSDGKDGLRGADGYTPRKGIDYFDGEDGKDGDKGEAGQASFTSYVFKKVSGEAPPARPTGGTFINPLPTTGDWTDGVPAGAGTLYLSTRIFTNDALAPQQVQWSLPTLAGDSTTLDFEWSSVAVPGTPTTNPDFWTNVAAENSIWMALRTLDGGVWSEWQVMKIKGETGPKGNDGTSGGATIMMFAKNGSFSTPPTLTPTQKTQRFPTGWSEDVPVLSSAEYLWKITARVNNANDLITNWSDPFRETGRMGSQGPKGPFLTPQGEFSPTKQYVGTVDRIEAVVYGGNWYVTRADIGNIPIGTLPTNPTYWNVADETFDFIATGLFLAEIAYIRNLGVENLKTADSGTRIEITKDENSLKFYVGGITQPVVTIDTDIAEDPYDPSGTNAGIRISALGVGGTTSTTTVSTSGIFSNAGNTGFYPASAGINAIASIVGLAFGRNGEDSVEIDAGIAGRSAVNSANNKNLKSIGGFFDILQHGGLIKTALAITNGQTLNYNGISASTLFSYMGSGQTATINLPNFATSVDGWKGAFGTGFDRFFQFDLWILNSGVNITINAQGGREIIHTSGTNTSYTATTGGSERAVFTFVYTGTHWIVTKKVI